MRRPALAALPSVTGSEEYTVLQRRALPKERRWKEGVSRGCILAACYRDGPRTAGDVGWRNTRAASIIIIIAGALIRELQTLASRRPWSAPFPLFSFMLCNRPSPKTRNNHHILLTRPLPSYFLLLPVFHLIASIASIATCRSSERVPEKTFPIGLTRPVPRGRESRCCGPPLLRSVEKSQFCGR